MTYNKGIGGVHICTEYEMLEIKVPVKFLGTGFLKIFRTEFGFKSVTPSQM